MADPEFGSDSRPQSDPDPGLSLSLAAQRRQRLLMKVTTYHEQLPGIRRLPLSVLGIVGALVAVNVVVWIAVGVVLVSVRAPGACKLVFCGCGDRGGYGIMGFGLWAYGIMVLTGEFFSGSSSVSLGLFSEINVTSAYRGVGLWLLLQFWRIRWG